MISDIDVLCMSMVFRIVCECNRTLIVDVDDVLIADVVADFSEKTEESYLLLESVKKSHVFQFRDGEGD